MAETKNEIVCEYFWRNEFATETGKESVLGYFC